MSGQEHVIKGEVVVNAPLDQVWNAWTTSKEAEAFFAPRCNIDPKPGGKYEMLFDLNAEPGKQGGEGMIVMAIQPQKMLAFTWNAPPHLPGVRDQMTHVIVRLHALSSGQTKVALRHDGWGEGGEWDSAYEYFERAWKGTVLPRLKHRFDVGPIDWNNPPDLSKS